VTGRLPRGRLNLVAVLCALPLLVALGRVIWLQAVQGPELRRRADSQQTRRVYLPPTRGEIRDRNGVSLAHSCYNYSIVAEPARVEDPRGAARLLARALNTSERALEKKLRSRRPQVDVWRQVTPLLERRVDLSALPGVYERLELKRGYPQGSSAAQVVGWVDSEGRGAGGIEREFDSILRGHPGWSTELRDGLGNSYPALGKRSKPAVPGHSVVLTLDAAFQDVAASELRKKVEELDAKGGALVAVDPRTGEILAMASWPTFDPEQVRQANPEGFKNRALADPYEPGSTFKLVATAAALVDHLLEPNTPIHCEEGRYRLAGRNFTDHHSYGTLPFRSCFAVSSNIAFAKVGELCGPRLYDLALALGFGRRTGVPLPGESPGLMREPGRWSRTSASTLAIGYEVLATPLQLALAYATVANDGVRMRPQLIKAILDPEGRVVYQGRPQAAQRVLEPAVARTIRSFMREVMTDGTGAEANLGWIEVGGKTGTSEKFVDGSYRSSKHYASFVGVAPLENPQIVLCVMLDEPHGDVFGGSAAAPVFREILESSGRMPGARVRPEYDVVSVPAPGPMRETFLLPAGVTAGDGQVEIPQTPSPGDGLPDVRGQSLRQALLVLRAHGVQVRVRGTGVVERQDPAPGSAVSGTVELTCSPSGATTLVGAPGGGPQVWPAGGSAAPGRR
jgi:cell division protein FtsI (penicillin-binding protein 3)